MQMSLSQWVKQSTLDQIDWMLQQCLFIRWREREERTCKKRPWATFTRHCSCLSAQSWKSKKIILKKIKKVRLWKCCHVSKVLEAEILLGEPDQKLAILNSKPEAFKYSGKEVRRQASSQKKIKLTLFAQGLLPAFQGVQNNWNWISN